MQDFFRIAQLLNANPLVLKRILDARRRVGQVGHGNHHRRRLDVSFLPCLRRFQPVLPQEVVALADEIRERGMWLRFAIEVRLYFQVGVDVVELRLYLLFSSPSSRTTTRGVFTNPDSIASLSPKSLTIHPKSVSSPLLRPVGANGVAVRS